jgi:hypothetical protein
MFALLFIGMFVEVSAAFVPNATPESAEVKPQRIENLIRELSVNEFEQFSGKKLNGIQKWQYKRLQKKLHKNAGLLIFPEREELTEGFQALPFFGTILTGGLLCLIMLFTARDSNAWRWSLNGLWVLALAVSVIALIGTLSGY